MNVQKQKICVVGLGYIGLPTASMFATHGHRVHGVDTNAAVIKTLRDGKIHIEEPGLATVVKAAISSQNLTVDTKPAESDVFIIAVPTPYFHGNGEIPSADMTYVQGALDSILPYLKKGNIVILESTSPPGTTRDLVLPTIKSKTNLEPGKDLGVAYCPERVIPGKALEELIGNDRVIGAISKEWGIIIRDLYKSFVSGEIYLTEPTVAEMVKVIENTYRDVNIAFANETARICEKLGINVWDVIEMANRHPRVHLHKPGPGVGGHCISVDPWFLVEKFPDEAKMIHLARNINDETPAYVVEIISRILKGKANPKITILGLAFKGNVDDDRESPAIEVIKQIRAKISGASIGIYDPHVNSKEFSNDSIESAFKDSDLAVILSAHDEYKYIDPSAIGTLMRRKIIFDTHHILKRDRWREAGFEVFTLGSGAEIPLPEAVLK